MLTELAVAGSLHTAFLEAVGTSERWSPQLHTSSLPAPADFDQGLPPKGGEFGRHSSAQLGDRQ